MYSAQELSAHEYRREREWQRERRTEWRMLALTMTAVGTVIILLLLLVGTQLCFMLDWLLTFLPFAERRECFNNIR